jgi:rRNA pseudouridine-1189 N-methylase Emg1 (Nep1/Mra1 family)
MNLTLYRKFKPTIPKRVRGDLQIYKERERRWRDIHLPRTRVHRWFLRLHTKTVMANIDMVIDNLEDFQSSVVSHSKLIREKYVTAVQPRFYHDGRYERNGNGVA